MAEIWKAKHANLVGLPCTHLRSRTRQQSRGFGGFRKAGFQSLLIPEGNQSTYIIGLLNMLKRFPP